MKNYHLGHRERLRNKFMKAGLDSFHDHEVLEMLLFQSIPFKDTNTIAHSLIEKFGSLSNVLDASYDNLITVNGVSHVTAVNIMFIRELFARYKQSSAQSVTISKLSDIISYSRMLFEQSPYERLVAVFIDSATRVIGTKEYTSKHKNAIKVDVKQVVKDGMNYSASGILLVHCHLNTITKPSQADIDYTEHIYNVLKSMNIVLMEHLIYTDQGMVFSFLKNGLFNKMKFNKDNQR